MCVLACVCVCVCVYVCVSVCVCAQFCMLERMCICQWLQHYYSVTFEKDYFALNLLLILVLQGLIQDLIITDDPGSAFEICEVYCPDCEIALPYGAVYTSSSSSFSSSSSMFHNASGAASSSSASAAGLGRVCITFISNPSW